MPIAPDMQPFVERYSAAWPVPGHQLPLAQWRGKYEQLVAAGRSPRPAGLNVTDESIQGVPVRIYEPQEKRPGAIIYFHGGGWVLGSVESHDDITADLAHDTGCMTVSVDYARAPEHRFPRAFDDAWTVVQHFMGLSEPLITAGDSAGANLAGACALAVSAGGSRLAGQVLFYPCVDVDFSRASYRRCTDSPFLDSHEMAWFWSQYAPDTQARQDWRALPMRASDAQLAALPPSFLTVAENDPLHDEGVAYAQRLREAGCQVHLERGEGLLHGYLRLRHQAAQPRRIYQSAVQWVRALADA